VPGGAVDEVQHKLGALIRSDWVLARRIPASAVAGHCLPNQDGSRAIRLDAT